MIKFSKEKVLLLHQLLIEATNEEVAEIGLSIACGNTKYEQLLEWIIIHKNQNYAFNA